MGMGQRHSVSWSRNASSPLLSAPQWTTPPFTFPAWMCFSISFSFFFVCQHCCMLRLVGLSCFSIFSVLASVTRGEAVSQTSKFGTLSVKLPYFFFFFGILKVDTWNPVIWLTYKKVFFLKYLNGEKPYKDLQDLLFAAAAQELILCLFFILLHLTSSQRFLEVEMIFSNKQTLKKKTSSAR